MQKEVILRYCNTCEKPLSLCDEGQEGFLCCDEQHCSVACLEKDSELTHAQWVESEEHYNNGDGGCCWTNWEIELIENQCDHLNFSDNLTGATCVDCGLEVKG